MATNSAQEQLMLELINRARMNPAAEAARQGIALNQGLAPGTISAAPKQVLAMNDFLVLSSDRHSNWMLVHDVFSHNETAGVGFTGVTPSSRMTAAGYVFAGPTIASGENISWTGVLPGPINITSAIIAQHKSLFLSPGHRLNILNATFEEVGIGQQHGSFLSGGTNYDASMVTQNFALSSSKTFVTGVVYNDTVVNDNFFSVGEQTAGRAVSAPAAADTTGAGGGYELAFTTGGAKTVSFNLATGVIQVGVTVGAINLKIDVVNGHEVWTNAHLSVLGGPVTELHALGIQGINLTGSAANERLFGNTAGNILNGGAGNDGLDGGGGNDGILGGAGADTFIGGLGIDTMAGGAGSDSFVYNAPLNAANRDVITDFSHVDDVFRLENAVMTTLGGPGALNAAFFRAGAAALDANDHIIYNKATGFLFYDSNGSAAGGVTLFGQLTNKPADIAFNDFAVI